ncbi:MAG: nucleotidyltransferase domain-containing protein [Candidatus Woesearchaeota archaeon]
MLQNYNKYKVLKVFLFSPTDSFRLRELSKMIELSPLSVVNYLREFGELSLVRKYTKRGIPYYQGLRDNCDFQLYQKLAIQYELHKSGLIRFLWEKLSPRCIVLFGSFAHGQAIEDSDIDLFLHCKLVDLDLRKYEKILGKKLHVLMESGRNYSEEFWNNLINGIVLRGYLTANDAEGNPK